MIPSRQTDSTARDEAKRRVRAKTDAQKGLPASEYIYNLLYATRTHAEAQAMIAEVRADAAKAVREGAAGIVRSYAPHNPSDDEGKAVAHALNLAADAVERGHR